MKRILYGALICALIVGVSIPLWPASVSAAGTAIYVDDDFNDDPERHMWDTIQEGIDDATDGAGDTVYVYAGTYNENVVADKSNLTIHGESSSLVTVDGNGGDHTIKMTADDVTVRQLKVTGATGTGFAGVYWGNVQNGYLDHCDITGNYFGVLLNSIYNQTIQCNDIHNNSNNGIQVSDSTLKDLTMNDIYNNRDGISLINSSKITIWYNKSYSNSRYGIYVDSLSYENDIYLNDFFDNTAGNGYSDRFADDNNWETPNKSQWFWYCYGGDPYSSFRGNYWGDYGGVDVSPLDGIGDTSHPLGSEADSYPLISSYTNYPMTYPLETCPGSPVPECTAEVAPPSPPAPPGGCFIATAAYGTASAAEIDVLRAFRDEVLLESTVGSQLVEWYYQTSPPVADFISENYVLRTLVREFVVDPIASLVEVTGSLWRD
ncbi:MAG TPA: CFI-box-CTERM domain-containing protein [Dehalococcoidia bacterium]|nr:CFI-box-CTERM domain-containing protein [Dehalococcoidia bacterium]